MVRAATGDKLGNLNFASKTAEYFREHIELPFFLEHLKGKGDGLKARADSAIPKAWLFETGTNQWRQVRRLAAQKCRCAARCISAPRASSASRCRCRRAASTST